MKTNTQGAETMKTTNTCPCGNSGPAIIPPTSRRGAICLPCLLEAKGIDVDAENARASRQMRGMRNE